MTHQRKHIRTSRRGRRFVAGKRIDLYNRTDSYKGINMRKVDIKKLGAMSMGFGDITPRDLNTEERKLYKRNAAYRKIYPAESLY